MVENAVDEGIFDLTVNLYDGGVYQRIKDEGNTAWSAIPIHQKSSLPYTLDITVGSSYDSPINFAYGKDGEQKWKSGEQKWKSDNSTICQQGDADPKNGKNTACFFSC